MLCDAFRPAVKGPLPLIHPARVIAHHQNVHVPDAFFFEARHTMQGPNRPNGRELAEQVKPPAHVVNKSSPARPAKHCSALVEKLLAKVGGFLGQHAFVMHGRADFDVMGKMPNQRQRSNRLHRVEHFHRRPDHLRPHAFAG